MKKKIIIAATVLLITALCGYLFKTKYAPWTFANSFFQQLEFMGVDLVDQDFFIPKTYTLPSKSWKEYYNNYLKWNNFYLDDSLHNCSINSLFDSWEKKYLTNILEYVKDSNPYSEPDILTFEKFTYAFGWLEFSDVDLAYTEIKDNRLTVVAYSNVRPISQNGKDFIEGRHKLRLVALYGKLGWKITHFDIDN
jgi:hypothetical protein